MYWSVGRKKTGSKYLDHRLCCNGGIWFVLFYMAGTYFPKPDCRIKSTQKWKFTRRYYSLLYLRFWSLWVHIYYSFIYPGPTRLDGAAVRCINDSGFTHDCFYDADHRATIT